MATQPQIWRRLALVSASITLVVITPLMRHGSADHSARPVLMRQTGLTGFSSIQGSADQALIETLTRQAKAMLEAEHNIKVHGSPPPQVLVTRFDGETRKERSAEERIAVGQRVFQDNFRRGRTISRVEVKLTPLGLRRDGEKVLLDALEETTQYYSIDRGGPPAGEQVEHVFVFEKSHGVSRTKWSTRGTSGGLRNSSSMVQTGYDPIYDSTGCDSDGYYPCDPNADDSSFCCFPEELTYSQIPPGPTLTEISSTIVPQTCDYDRNAAATYAFNQAYNANPYFRIFDPDCTNFVSQSLNWGGWTNKGFGNSYKNWGLWWYDEFGGKKTGQTRSWTQARALRYFVENSGRGFITRYPCDLDIGDVIFADWENDGVIDHVMIITYRVYTTNCWDWSGILCSQHSHARQNKPLSQYVSENPNATFHALWICHNN
ncbi:MAG: hypothetical protein DMF61_15000 [Blastocatellia bacterium AA13]|nr:MAG: hypothetical protein DMF61_15000 [Blastocatellia bacterium AA13]